LKTEFLAGQNDNWWVSEHNFCDEVKREMTLPKQVRIHDATLRDGEQSPGVVFSREDKIAIAKALDELGVDRIEAGMPAVSEEDADAIKTIANLGLKAKIMVFCRAREEDIRRAKELGAWGVVIEVPAGYPRLLYQYKKWSEDDICKLAIENISLAKKLGLYTVLFPMDATRAKIDFLKKLVTETSDKATPDSLTLVDTTGSAIPLAIRYLIRSLKSWAPSLPLEIHTHNDFGLAVAGTMAAIEEGAEVMHGCVNGLGSRCGNASLEQLIITLKTLYGVNLPVNFEKIYSVSKLVRDCSGVAFGFNQPVVGEVAFTKETGMGMDIAKETPAVLFPLLPQLVGRELMFSIGKKSGKASIKMKLEELGISLDDALVGEVLKRVKEKAKVLKRELTNEDFSQIINDLK